MAYYPVRNHVGSTTAVYTNANPPGTSSSANYYSYGKVSVNVNTLHEPLKFTVMPYDSVAELYLVGTRFYDPTIGKVRVGGLAGFASKAIPLCTLAESGAKVFTVKSVVTFMGGQIAAGEASSIAGQLSSAIVEGRPPSPALDVAKSGLTFGFTGGILGEWGGGGVRSTIFGTGATGTAQKAYECYYGIAPCD